MHKVEKYVTYDGKEHATKALADRHLDKLYGNLISSISHNMIIDTGCSYSKVVSFIDQNLSRFILLEKIRTDMKITGD